MSRKNNKKNGQFTRQGVRDLSALKGQSLGRKVELPPEQFEEIQSFEAEEDSMDEMTY